MCGCDNIIESNTFNLDLKDTKMDSFKRFFMAAILGLMITVGLVFFMIALISLNSEAPKFNNNLTTQVKLSAMPGLKPSTEINSESKKKHYKLPSERQENLPIDHKSLLSQITAQEADGDQTDSLASLSRQQIAVNPGSQSQALVKVPGLFNVIGPDPKHPEFALSAGQEGWVETLIHLKKDGSVNKIDIINASPAGVFEMSVFTAVTDWKVHFDRMDETEISDQYFHRFEFKIVQ
ncbi:MAG: hypothetical protein DWP95_04080 [Proteobacteria bacterium]|nr:MAG: hypothetical protein DWP95_04080 [Pseudomonadota bacterium]